MADVNKLRELLAKATQYPAWGGWPDPVPSRHGTDHFTIGDAPPYLAAVRRVEDATLIAEMHRALPELLANAEASESLRVDAMRYRVLRDVWGRFICRGGKMEAGISTPSWIGPWDTFDAAIDAATSELVPVVEGS